MPEAAPRRDAAQCRWAGRSRALTEIQTLLSRLRLPACLLATLPHDPPRLQRPLVTHDVPPASHPPAFPSRSAGARRLATRSKQGNCELFTACLREPPPFPHRNARPGDLRTALEAQGSAWPRHAVTARVVTTAAVPAVPQGGCVVVRMAARLASETPSSSGSRRGVSTKTSPRMLGILHGKGPRNPTTMRATSGATPYTWLFQLSKRARAAAVEEMLEASPLRALCPRAPPCARIPRRKGAGWGGGGAARA